MFLKFIFFLEKFKKDLKMYFSIKSCKKFLTLEVLLRFHFSEKDICKYFAKSQKNK